MRKTVIFILSFVLLGFIHSCDNSKSMQEYIREEKKAIERYILLQGIEVLSEYPQNHAFNENQYFKTREGLYMNVVDPGNTARRAKLYDEIMVRFDYMYEIKRYVSGDTSKIVLSYLDLPIEFKYGINTDKTGFYACRGFAIPLDSVGEGAVVNLIIPSALGSTGDNNQFIPVFYKNLKYTKFR